MKGVDRARKAKTNGKPTTITKVVAGSNAAQESPQLADVPQISDIKSQSGVDLTEKIKELIRLAKEQGYLTYNDINDALPDNVVSAEDLDEIYIRLRNLEIDIVDQAEVDRVKQPEPEEEEDKSRLDILDDPVRMYLKQMGQVPLLTREQEVEISKRIESAENELKRIIYSFGFSGKEHIALAEKLISEPPKERFDRVIVDKKIENREEHLKDLRKLVKSVRTHDLEVDEKYAKWHASTGKAKKDRFWWNSRSSIRSSRIPSRSFITSKRSSRKWPWSPRIFSTNSRQASAPSAIWKSTASPRKCRTSFKAKNERSRHWKISFECFARNTWSATSN
jgi:RNA polymerase primary sigma factor